MIDQSKLPKNWEVKKLGELCNDKDGLRRGPFGSAIKKEFFVPCGYKVYEQANAIYNDAYRGRYYIDEKKYQELINFQVLPGDLIVSCSGTLGRIAEIPSDAPPGIINQALLRIRLKDNAILRKFFLFHFRSAFFQKKIFDQSQGTAMSNLIGIKDFKEIELPVPSLNEQQRIVAKIEALFSELDAGVASLKTAQAQLKTYHQAVLKWAFEGRLTNEHLPDGELPHDWKWVKLGELMESVRNGYSKKPDDKGTFPILRISSVRPFKIDLSDVRFLEKSLDKTNAIEENDLLFTRYNGSRDFVGVCARTPALKETIYYPDKLIRCRPVIKTAAHSSYIQYAANTGDSREYVLSRLKTTAGQTGISGEEIKSIPIPLCSLEEQQRIVQEIESRLSVCDKLEETIAASLRQADALRQSILKKAFEGRLVAQDGLDEITDPAPLHREDEPQTSHHQMDLFA